MPTTRTATAITSLLAAILVPTIIQKNLTATETIAQETGIDCEMKDMLQRETDITKEIDGTQFAETVIEMSIRGVAVTVSPIPFCQLLPLLQSVVSVLWLLLHMVRTPPSKDVIASTMNEIVIEKEKETGREKGKETRKEKENANSVIVNKSTNASSASAKRNSGTGSATSVNTKGNVKEI
jgi:hypothetical protein